MGLIQRVLDEAGLCTASITQAVEITAIVKPSRAVFVAHPFGLTFGAVGDTETQRAVFDALISAAVDMEAQGIRDTGLTWSRDDLRARQLRKQRHRLVTLTLYMQTATTSGAAEAGDETPPAATGGGGVGAGRPAE